MNQKSWQLRLVKVINLILITLPLAGCWIFYYRDHVIWANSTRLGFAVILLFNILYYQIGQKTYDAFRISFYRILELCQSQFLSYVIADTCLFAILVLLTKGFPRLLPAFLALLAQKLLSVLWCIAANKWYNRHFSPDETVVIHDGASRFDETILRYGREIRFRIAGKYTVDECLADPSCLDGVQIVFLDCSHTKRRDDIISYCIEHRITCFVIPMINDAVMRSARQAHMMHTPMLKLTRPQPRPEYVFLKRAGDLFLSSVLIVLFSPLMAVLAVLISRDGGPALYKQTRLTKDNRQFMLIKFRSMIVDAEKDGVARLSTGEDDSRITKIGRFIRACRMDELPQLFNIFMGDMSFVGPRPERPEIAAEYEKEIPDFRLRLQVKAGLTGLAQIYGQYNTPPQEKLVMDLLYISQLSLVEDCRLFFATLGILFKKDSTEGVSEGAVSAIPHDSEEIRRDSFNNPDNH